MFDIFKRSNQHFIQSQGMQFASALSYSTLLSVVPVTMLLFFLSLQTDFFASMFLDVREQLLTQLLPTSRQQVESYLLQTTQNIQSFSYLSVAIIFLSAIWLSLGVEKALNHIWHVKKPRTILLRIPAHLILWLLTPILIMTSIALSSWFFSLPYLSDVTHQIPLTSKLIPFIVSAMALFLLYRFVPNTHVNISHAIKAALVAGALFEVSKWLFTIYITQFAMYEKLYGALATLPIFMLWIFISWAIVLWGASFSVVLQKQGHQA